MRDAERNCRTFEPFIPPYTPPNANRDTASKAFEDFDSAEDALKLPGQSSVDQGSSVSDVSHAFPRAKKRRIEAVVCTAASLVVISSVGLMAVLLSPQNKSAATHDVSDTARLDLQTVSLGSAERTHAENAVGTSDASPVDQNEADESSIRTQPGKPAVQTASTEFVNYWMTVSAAIPTEAKIRNRPMRREPEDKLQSAIRELLISSANATSYRDPGISTQ